MSLASQVGLVGRTLTEWQEWFTKQGQKPFRARQLFQWIHQRGVFDPEQMTNLSQGLRGQLAAEGLGSPLEVDEVSRSADGTRKLLLKLPDASRVECVLIPMTPGANDADLAVTEEEELNAEDLPLKRVTLCVSTQVGCAMGCAFCASGQAGLTRGLSAGEVVTQVLIAKRYLEPGENLRNLVFMGMGEPLHHYEQTRRAIELITHPDGLGMSPRRITVSTVGLVPGIRRLGEDFAGKLGLAVSLHAPDNETRDLIMPMNRRYDVPALIAALKAYPLPNRRRITIEYILIDSVNDSIEHAERLGRLLRGLRVKVNLIPMNPIGASDFAAPSSQAVDAFQAHLANRRISCSVRRRKGDDVDAACGQLALKKSGLIPEGNLRPASRS